MSIISASIGTSLSSIFILSPILNGKENNNPRRDIAQDRPLGKHRHTYHGKNRRNHQKRLFSLHSPDWNQSQDYKNTYQKIYVFENQPDSRL